MPISSSRQILTKTTSRRVANGYDTAGKNQKTKSDTPVSFKLGVNIQKFSKTILCQASPVFQAMLQGNFQKPKEGYYVIEDISPRGFALFLKSVNSIHGEKKSLKHRSLLAEVKSLEDALMALYASHKYAVVEVESTITSNISREIHWTNVLSILVHAEVLGNTRLESKCWSIIESFTTQVIQTTDFLSISWDLLCSILENSHLKVNEFMLFKCVFNWCQNEKKQKKTKQSLREILGVAIYKIRFPLMTVGEFHQATTLGLLAEGEIEDLECNFKRDRGYSSRQLSIFLNVPRRNACQCKINRLSLNCRLCVCNGKMSSIRPDMFKHKITDGIHLNCECRKYKSCPNYPNGATAQILLEMASN